MILEQQAQHADPELCRRLWELGVDTGTAMYWRAPLPLNGEGWALLSGSGFAPALGEHPSPLFPYQHYPAYSVAELGESLKGRIETNGCPWWICGAWQWSNFAGNYSECPTEADARAALLIHIIEQERG